MCIRDSHRISASFPWDRLFEITALVSSTPQYRIYLTEEEINKRQAAAKEKTKQQKKQKSSKNQPKAKDIIVPLK